MGGGNQSDDMWEEGSIQRVCTRSCDTDIVTIIRCYGKLLQGHPLQSGAATGYNSSRSAYLGSCSIEVFLNYLSFIYNVVRLYIYCRL